MLRKFRLLIVIYNMLLKIFVESLFMLFLIEIVFVVYDGVFNNFGVFRLNGKIRLF